MLVYDIGYFFAFVAKPKDIPPEFVEAFKDTVYLLFKL